MQMQRRLKTGVPSFTMNVRGGLAVSVQVRVHCPDYRPRCSGGFPEYSMGYCLRSNVINCREIRTLQTFPVDGHVFTSSCSMWKDIEYSRSLRVYISQYSEYQRDLLERFYILYAVIHVLS